MGGLLGKLAPIPDSHQPSWGVNAKMSWPGVVDNPDLVRDSKEWPRRAAFEKQPDLPDLPDVTTIRYIAVGFAGVCVIWAVWAFAVWRVAVWRDRRRGVGMEMV